MGNFIKFTDWEKTKYPSNIKEEEEQTSSSEHNAEILAQISELVARRKSHIKNKEDFEAQILEIDIKILKAELEINELKEKRKQLAGAKDIAANRRREGKNKED